MHWESVSQESALVGLGVRATRVHELGVCESWECVGEVWELGE